MDAFINARAVFRRMDMRPVGIRMIRRDELPALIALYVHLHHEDAPLPDDAALAAVCEAIPGDPKLQCFVAERDGQLAGSCTLITIPNLTRGARPYGLIENVVTHADYRRQGIGTRVLHAALRRAWESNCYKVMLPTRSTREVTLRFYERAGFKRGIKTGFVAHPEA
ncbi:MAG TPA: GNAT family N-acetyltransferase [Herpetosiphonaceae bacterium]|nr:GNAT family N-acetyltransferase [Herpetosiphonaceae bacterium]